jgi:hypothetical protein
MMESVMTELVADSGLPAAVTAYRELKRRYYGSYTFDFRSGRSTASRSTSCARIGRRTRLPS